MKFAKEIEQDLVPEWRAKYLDYKTGKKKVKDVARAIDRASPRKTPRSPFHSPARNEAAEPFRSSPAPLGSDSRPGSEESDTAVPIPIHRPSNHSYGSFVATPPQDLGAGPLLLPDPALHPLGSSAPARPEQPSKTVSPKASMFSSLRNKPPQNTLGRSNSATPTHKPLTKRLLTNRMGTPDDINLQSYQQVKLRQGQFFEWMDSELEKIETFYKTKEHEAGERLVELREQLHEMRNRRIREIEDTRRARDTRKSEEQSALESLGIRRHAENGHHQSSSGVIHAWMEPIEQLIDNARAAIIPNSKAGSNTEALQNMTKSPAIPSHANHVDPGRDYQRRLHDHEVPYRSAKRKLKLALKEFYRGLELLKSYALLNRTGFRKINKKYDKTVNAHPPLRYMTEKVNKAWFVKSEVLEGHIHAVEDLYARYFERGNHKVAVGKLRTASGKPGQFTSTTFRSGLMIGIGAVFAIQGLIYAVDILHSNEDAVIKLQASYLLQIYGGYFLALYLFGLFCIDASIWVRNKINYVFIFEFDPAHHLDWREMSEFPSFMALLLGVFMWINFSQWGSPALFIYYPILLIFITVLVIFFPAPIMWHRSRSWIVYSHWRLLLAGLYPVEFRDFFLGDMYCSLTYMTSNIALLFCLCAQHWDNPPQCNSSNSRLLGFFSAIPGIWRALQCIRRYYDTRAVFPHLVNCGKYTMTIMYYCALSLYRINEDRTLLAVFITFAAINATYTSIWDIAMDWSLLQPHANKPLLRDVRGYKYPLVYYLAIPFDVIIRFNWIFYAIFTHDTQHNTVANFFVAFTEVTRRGIWTLFRVENEHCANVLRFKASRDVPLPYKLRNTSTESVHGEEETPSETRPTQASSPQLSRHRTRTTATEADEDGRPETLRMRARTLTRIFADAHTQDFEKKRKSVEEATTSKKSRSLSSDDDKANSSDEEEGDEDVVEIEHAHELHRLAEEQSSE